MKKNKNNETIDQLNKEAQFSDEEMENVNGGLKENDEEKGFICGFFPGLSGFP